MGYRTPDITFGDGSDGHAHYTIAGGATQLLPKAEMQYASLEIDAGVTLKQKQWKNDLSPVCRIYCRTPIVLNGVLSVSEVVCSVARVNNMSPGVLGENQGGFFNGPGEPPIGDGYPIFPIAGGGSIGGGSHVTWADDFPGYSADVVPSGGGGADGDSIFIGDRGVLIGPNKMFRYCAGCGGATGDQPGGTGAGIIIVTAPSIIFGANGGVEAMGGDGFGDGENAGSAGGGGGYIETNTRIAIAAGDIAKLDVSGGAGSVGAGGNDGGAGTDGHVVRRLI